jgi:Pyruvate/2-oxoacid:ferredoxin oxidoreductase delta subunit
MGKRYKYLCNLYDLWVISNGEKRERKREKLKQKLDSHRAKKEDELDQKDEALMKTYGYHRCNSCKLYSSPDRMLESVASASLKVANESQKFKPDEIVELQKLIMNSGKPKPVEKKELEKFKFVLNKVSVKCGSCECLFNDNKCGECGGAAMFCVDSVIQLQEQHIAMHHAYQTRLDIELAHEMVV